uniref:hypothetical protein n=1 Tax=Gluconobacter thailandicus TaxID=257438 RepID=UPI001E496F84|nr:hypothetical protein [Gluconobacter thailandicus]
MQNVIIRANDNIFVAFCKAMGVLQKSIFTKKIRAYNLSVMKTKRMSGNFPGKIGHFLGPSGGNITRFRLRCGEIFQTLSINIFIRMNALMPKNSVKRFQLRDNVQLEKELPFA